MKKIASIFLALVLIAGLTMGVSAAPALAAVDENNFQAVMRSNASNGKILLNKTKIPTLEKLASLDVKPDDEVKIYLTANMFLDSSGNKVTSANGGVTNAQLRAGKITIRKSTSSGSKIIDSIALRSDTNGAYISVRFVEHYASVDDQDFALTFYLTVDGKRKNSTAMLVKGTLEADIVEAYSDDDYVDISEGQVVEAMESVRGIELDLGCGVSLYTNLSKGKRYYGVASDDISEADDSILSKNDGVEIVFTVRSVNLKATGKAVEFFDLDDTYYVYDVDGKYLGNSDGRVTFSKKYYLSSVKYDSLKM